MPPETLPALPMPSDCPASGSPPLPDTVPADRCTTPGGDDPNRTAAYVSAAPASFPQLPGFEIQAELGRGGMGVVYRAKQAGLDRTVALKMILKADFASAEQKLRFQIEAENAARVQHPNIVQVFEIGEHQGQPYFALEHVEGGSLADWLATHRPSPAEAAALVETLARAVHAAHLQGIIHRDLKPANILMASPGRKSGESAKSAALQPKIADFGLAKREGAAHDLTGSGAIMGTPSYMSPEQARGDTKHVGPAADQYALGVIFYQMLTGRLPFEAPSVPALLKKIAEDEPAAPRSRNGAVPADLSVICLQALEKAPAKRYSSAEAFAEDLRNWREHRPIAARPATRTERVLKWCRRYPAVAALIAVSVLAAIVASGLAWWAVGAERAAVKERDDKELERKRTEKERDEKEKQRSRAEREKANAVAVRDFLRNNLIRQASVWEQANVAAKSAQAARHDLTVRDLLARAALEFAPDRIEARFPGQPEVQAEVLETIGEAFEAVGDSKQAILFVKGATAVRAARFGPDHPVTLDSQVILAFTHLAAGQQGEAVSLLLGVLRRLEAVLAAGNPEQSGDAAEQALNAVVAAAERRLDLRRFVLPPISFGFADGALLALQMGQALPIVRKLADLAETRFGPDDRRVIYCRLIVGFVLQALGQIEPAASIYQQTLSRAEKLLHADDPLLIGMRSVLAFAYAAAGRRPEIVRDLWLDVVAALERSMGPGHPATRTAQHNLADALSRRRPAAAGAAAA